MSIAYKISILDKLCTRTGTNLLYHRSINIELCTHLWDSLFKVFNFLISFIILFYLIITGFKTRDHT